MIVNVQNENALGTGYIFRETDDWTGKAGGVEIRKVVPVANIPREYWGTGSIDVQGTGTVTDASVVYSYRVDPCYDPQFDPNCPGYKPYIPDIDIIDVADLYDATAGDSDISTTDVDYKSEEELSEEEKKKRQEEEDKDSKERLEKALAAIDNSALFANAFDASKMLDQINSSVNMNPYYAAYIAGGEYNDSIELDGGNLPDNKNGRKYDLSSQKLHTEMVDMQYK
jgi:hypothetical protein